MCVCVGEGGGGGEGVLITLTPDLRLDGVGFSWLIFAPLT